MAEVHVGQPTQKQRQRSNQVQHKMLLMADLPGVWPGNSYTTTHIYCVTDSPVAACRLCPGEKTRALCCSICARRCVVRCLSPEAPSVARWMCPPACLLHATATRNSYSFASTSCCS